MGGDPGLLVCGRCTAQCLTLGPVEALYFVLTVSFLILEFLICFVT